MDDLVERLREYADYRATADDLSRCLFSAADRIEQLEAALEQIERENTFPPTIANEVGRKCGPFAVIARAALGEKNK